VALERSSDPAISIIIPTYNRCANLERLLRALDRACHRRSRFEVVVVVDGATDRTVDMLGRLRVDYPLRVVAQANSGPAAARNRGIAEASGELLLFIDDDVIPVDDLIERHLEIHRRDPDAVVIGSLTAPAGAATPWARWEANALGRHFRAIERGDKPVTARHFYTGNASVRRHHVRRVGGFDEAFRRGEDAELGYRLGELGLRFSFAAAASVEHVSDHPLHDWLAASYKYGCQDVAMARDHGRPHALELAFSTWNGRHPLTRLLASWCVGHPRRLRATLGILSGLIGYAGPCAPVRLQMALSGAVANVQYWQGVADATGSGHRVWCSLAEPTSAQTTSDRAVRRTGGALAMANRLLRGLPGTGRYLLKAARLAASLIAYTPGDLKYVPWWLMSLRSRGQQLAAQVPWLPYSAIAYLAQHVSGQAVVFEYGGGGSTLWLAKRVRQLTTVEHDAGWCANLDRTLRARNLTNVTLVASPPRADAAADSARLPNGITYGSSSWPGNFETYVKSIDRFPDDSLDLVLVDGRSRAACVVHAARKVKPGGVLVLDDSDRPCYHAAIRELRAWPRRDFWGIRPFSLERSHTTCWTRPT
jgi:GT2 family glycosyltransferase